DRASWAGRARQQRLGRDRRQVLAWSATAGPCSWQRSLQSVAAIVSGAGPKGCGQTPSGFLGHRAGIRKENADWQSMAQGLERGDRRMRPRTPREMAAYRVPVKRSPSADFARVGQRILPDRAAHDRSLLDEPWNVVADKEHRYCRPLPCYG